MIISEFEGEDRVDDEDGDDKNVELLIFVEPLKYLRLMCESKH